MEITNERDNELENRLILFNLKKTEKKKDWKKNKSQRYIKTTSNGPTYE